MKLWRLAIQIIPKTWSLKFLNKLIKNFVNTHREKDVAKPIKVKKDEVATKGNKDNSIRKASNSKEKKADGKRPKSSVDLNNINKNSTSQIIFLFELNHNYYYNWRASVSLSQLK